MRRAGLAVSVMLAALGLVACGGPAPTDAGDSGMNNGETGGDAHPTDGSATPSLAGHVCTDDSMCGTAGLGCAMTGVKDNFCSAMCTNNTSQTMEAAQCGGTGGTCLTIGDPGGMNPPTSLCTHSCRGSAAMPGCLAADQVCTGFWYTHMGLTPDATGCFPFCHNDGECPTGQHCDRVGSCGDTAINNTLHPDGEPCNPSTEPMMGPSTQCRGICFQTGTANTQGTCGSFIDVQTVQACPDGAAVPPLAPAGDKLGLCIFKQCNCDMECTSPQLCIVQTAGMPGVCGYPDTTMGEHGTPTCPTGGDAG